MERVILESIKENNIVVTSGNVWSDFCVHVPHECWLLNLETDSDFTYSPWSSLVTEVCLEGCSELLSCDWFREIFLWAVIVLGTSAKWLVLKWPWIPQWNYQRECVLCLSFRFGHSHMIFSHVFCEVLFIYYSQKLWLEKDLRRAFI